MLLWDLNPTLLASRAAALPTRPHKPNHFFLNNKELLVLLLLLVVVVVVVVELQQEQRRPRCTSTVDDGLWQLY